MSGNLLIKWDIRHKALNARK